MEHKIYVLITHNNTIHIFVCERVLKHVFLQPRMFETV